MQTKKTHWLSLLILIVLGVSVAFTILITLALGVNSIITLFSEEGDAAGQMISAFAFGFEAVILLACSWFVLQKTLGHGQAETPFKFPFAGWLVIPIIGVPMVSVAIGGVVAYSEIAWLAWIVLPPLTVFVIVPPILLLFGLGTNGIELGPRWRIFGALGLSMTIGSLIMIVAELVLLLAIIIAGTIVIAVQQPDLFRELVNLGRILKQEMNEEVILKLLAPYISNPLVIATMLGYVAFLVPMIEELFKPLAVWIFARNLESPAQGFAMGLLSGAAFALLESLNASSDGSMSWSVLVSIRAATSLLHITASGLVGWGIASAFREKRIMRFFGAYFTAVAIHGIWNACAGGSAIAEVFVSNPDLLFKITRAASGGMIMLGIGMFLLLRASNRKLKSLPSSPTLPPVGEGSLAPLPPGESQDEGNNEGVQ